MITTTEGQSLLDLAATSSGSIEAIFDLAKANGIGITDIIAPNTPIQTLPTAIKPEIARYFGDRRIRINTGYESLPSTMQDFDPNDFSSNDFL